MKVEELKNFLRLHGLKVSGRKEELVARVFVAIENNVQIVQTNCISAASFPCGSLGRVLGEKFHPQQKRHLSLYAFVDGDRSLS